MGAYLSQPNTTKTSSDGGNGKMSYGFSAMQGWRVSMEVSNERSERARNVWTESPLFFLSFFLVNETHVKVCSNGGARTRRGILGSGTVKVRHATKMALASLLSSVASGAFITFSDYCYHGCEATQPISTNIYK